MKITHLIFATVVLLTFSGCDKLMRKTPAPESKAATGLTAQGYDMLAKDQPQAAETLFDQALAADAQNVRALQGKGIALSQLGKYDAAEKAYGKALALSPGSLPITNNLAMSKILKGDYEEAITILTPLSKSGNETVMENLALANCMSGKRDEARKLYSKSLTPKQVEENLQFCNSAKAQKK